MCVTLLASYTTPSGKPVRCKTMCTQLAGTARTGEDRALDDPGPGRCPHVSVVQARAIAANLLGAAAQPICRRQTAPLTRAYLQILDTH